MAVLRLPLVKKRSLPNSKKTRREQCSLTPWMWEKHLLQSDAVSGRRLIGIQVGRHFTVRPA